MGTLFTFDIDQGKLLSALELRRRKPWKIGPAMLECAEDALGAEFFGYKGGEYTMSQRSEVYIADVGETTDGPLDEVALERMLYPERFATSQPGALSCGEMAIWAAAYVASLANHPGRLDKACSDATETVEQLRWYVAAVAPEGRGMAGEMVSAASQ